MTAPAQPTPKCEQCGYDVRGLSPEERCPECGWEIGELRRLNRITRLDLAKRQTIRWHAACTECGYDLQGLMLDQQCPECGTPLLHSFGARLLRYAPAGRVRKVYHAAALQLLGYLLTAPLVFACSPHLGMPGLIVWSLGLIWLAKTRGPGWRARVVMTGAIGLLVLVGVLELVLFWRPTQGGPAAALLAFVFFTVCGGSLVLMLDIGRRLANGFLRSAHRVLLWLVPVPIAAIVLMIFWTVNGPALVPWLVVAVAVLAAVIWYISCGLATYGFVMAVGSELDYAKRVAEDRTTEPATPADSPVD